MSTNQEILQSVSNTPSNLLKNGNFTEASYVGTGKPVDYSYPSYLFVPAAATLQDWTGSNVEIDTPTFLATFTTPPPPGGGYAVNLNSNQYGTLSQTVNAKSGPMQLTFYSIRNVWWGYNKTQPDDFTVVVTEVSSNREIYTHIFYDPVFQDANNKEWNARTCDFNFDNKGLYKIEFRGTHNPEISWNGSFIGNVVLNYKETPVVEKIEVEGLEGKYPLQSVTTPTKTSFPAINFWLADSETKLPIKKKDVNFIISTSGHSGIHFSGNSASDRYPTQTDENGIATVPAGLIQAGLMADKADELTVCLDGVSALPALILKVTSDKWTIHGSVPSTISEKSSVPLTLLKNGKSSEKAETLTVRLDTPQYLTVEPSTITVKSNGIFTLTLTPKPGQTGNNTTTLTLVHDGQDLTPSYKVTTGAAPVSKYDIKVSDQDSSAIVTGQKVYWSEKNEHSVTVSVVEHNTATPVDADIKVISDNSALTVEGQLPFRFHKNGAALKVYLRPNGGGTATLTFSTAGAENVTFTVKLGTVTSKALLVNHSELWLAPGFTASESGEDSPLEVSYNPPVNSGEGTPPAINYEITGTGLTVIDEVNNENMLHGDVTPKGPKYIFLPRLVTDPAASKDCSITFSTATGEYTPATVAVHIASADHIKWQPSGQVEVDADSTTNLGLRLKVLDSADHTLSSFALNVVIDSQGDAGAHFAGTQSTTTYPITSAGRDGWVTLPELVVKNMTGNFSLSVRHPGDHVALNDPLKFKVVQGQGPSQINLYPKTNPTLQLSRVGHGISGNDYYAELLTPSNKPARNGDISFELSAGTANASFKDNRKLKMAVPVNSQDGTASMPTIQVEQQGTFTLLARHDALVTSALTFTIT